MQAEWWVTEAESTAAVMRPEDQGMSWLRSQSQGSQAIVWYRGRALTSIHATAASSSRCAVPDTKRIPYSGVLPPWPSSHPYPRSDQLGWSPTRKILHPKS